MQQLGVVHQHEALAESITNRCEATHTSMPWHSRVNKVALTVTHGWRWTAIAEPGAPVAAWML